MSAFYVVSARAQRSGVEGRAGSPRSAECLVKGQIPPSGSMRNIPLDWPIPPLNRKILGDLGPLVILKWI